MEVSNGAPESYIWNPNRFWANFYSKIGPGLQTHFFLIQIPD